MERSPHFCPYAVGSYSPAPLLKAFVQAVEASLSTVTSLILSYQQSGGSSVTTFYIQEAMGWLVSACPSLKSVRIQGHLPMSFFCSIGSCCPFLSALTLEADDEELAYLQKVVLLQPSLLPNISSLVLLGIRYSLPNMSQNTGILSLEMPDLGMTDESCWSRLPSNLKHLKCGSLNAWPLPCDASTDLFSSLLSLEVRLIATDLHALTLLLKEAPCPRQIKQCRFGILCTVDHHTAADLFFLHQQMQVGDIGKFDYEICCDWRGTADDWVPQFLSNLPCITGITQCVLNCMDANLLPMLRAFPDLEAVNISHCNALTDLELHSLTACRKLQSIHLLRCHSVTPMGMLALCCQHPGLRMVGFDACEMLRGPQLQLCVQLLTRYGSQVEVRDHDAEHLAAQEIEAPELADGL